MKILVIGSGDRPIGVRTMLMMAALAQAGHEVTVENLPVRIKGQALATPVVVNEKPSAWLTEPRKGKGDKKRQRSEWNNSMYNNRKGLQRG